MNRKTKAIIVLLSLAGELGTAYAYNSPVNGTYLGFSIGPNYIHDIKNITFPAVPPITTTITNPTLQHKLGIGGALQIGFRMFDRFRLEGEIFSSYNKPRRLNINGTKIPNTVFGINGHLNSTYSFFFNGYIDALTMDISGYNQLAPYVGLGVGKVRTDTEILVYNSGSQIATPIHKGQIVSAAQAIVGINYYLDDFTAIGLNYRLQAYKRLDALNKAIYKSNIQITFAFSFENLGTMLDRA